MLSFLKFNRNQEYQYKYVRLNYTEIEATDKKPVEFRFVPDDEWNRLWGKEIVAITYEKQRRIYCKISTVTGKVLDHELAHIHGLSHEQMAAEGVYIGK